MMAALNRRNLVLVLAMAATLALVAWVDRQEQANEDIQLVRPDRPASKPAPRKTKAADAPLPAALDWVALDGRDVVGDAPAVDLFRAQSWYVPPPPKPAEPPPPPPRPVAPPAPFAYLGKMEDTPQGTLMILSGGNKVYTVAVGESIDKSWRVDGEDAGSVRLTYLPLGLPQTLSKSARPAAARPNEPRKTEHQGTAS